MHPIDWIFVIVPIVLVASVAIFTNRYVRSVADFLARPLNEFRSAMDAYAEAEMLAKQAKDEKREKFARERFAAVEPKSLKLVVRVADAASTGIEVKRNNVVVPPAQWGIPVAVDPEDFVITASAPGRAPWRGAVIGRGEGAIITIVVPTL